MAIGEGVIAGRVVSLCKGPVAESASFLQELKDNCCGFRRERAETEVMVVCKVRLGPEGLLIQKESWISFYVQEKPLEGP